MNEEDILASLEESVDYSGGFVSSFTLPLAGDGGYAAAAMSSGDSKASSSPVPANPRPPLQPTHKESPRQLSPSASVPPRMQKSPDIFRSPSGDSVLLASSLNVQIPGSNGLAPPPDLLSPKSIASDGTDLVCNFNDEVGDTEADEQSGRMKPFHVPRPSLDTVNTNASTPPRSGHSAAAVGTVGVNQSQPKPRRRCDNSNNQSSDSSHNKSKNPISNKRKKKSSSRKNNLVILPWNTPFRHSKSDLSAIASSHQKCYTTTAASQKSSTLPPPHPLSHVQSYPPTTHPHYVQSSHRYPQHFHSHSFASDASSSEATPITCPANIRRDRNCSIDESLDADMSNHGEHHIHGEERGIATNYDRQNSCETYEGDVYFRDFDDTISKDSVANKEGDLIGVQIHMDNRDRANCNTLVDAVPHSTSTNSLLGLEIHDIPQPQKAHRNKSSLEYSPATMITFADAHGNAISPMPLIPTETTEIPLLPTTDIQYHQDETDDGSVLSIPQCSVNEDTPTPPTSPNPHLHKSPKKRHHRHQSSLVSCSESCLESQCSYESQNIFNYPNPTPQILQDAGVSPLDSSYSFEEDRSLCADEKAFVQQIHNSGLSSLSFEHVEDALDRTSMDVEMELVYNNGSFDNGSVGGGSVESSGSVMSVEERKEIERTIHVYRKFREKRSKMGSLIESAKISHMTMPQGVPATPVASNKGIQQLQMPDLHAIDQFNQECDDNFESLEMAPLAAQTDDDFSNTNDQPADEKLHPGSKPELQANTSYIASLFWWWNTNFDSNTARQPRYDFTYKGFDDVDFDRGHSLCVCFPTKTRDRFYSNHKFWMHTGWGKLMVISCCFLLIGWLFSGGELRKHESQESYYSRAHRSRHGYKLYGEDDPLAKESFVPQKRIIDDTDDFAVPMSRLKDDDVDFSIVEKYYPNYSRADDLFKRFEMQDDMFDGLPSADEAVQDAVGAPFYGVDNDEGKTANDIDTISVLGERHSRIDWLVRKLKILYPNLNVISGFPSKKNRVDGEWFQPEDGVESTTSKHILVIALFINPYDWVELMRADHEQHCNNAMNWKTFLESQWSPDIEERGCQANLTSIIPNDDDDADWDDNTASSQTLSDRDVGRNLVSNSSEVFNVSSRYEFQMDGTTYYSSVLELRAAKIRAAVKGSLYRPSVLAAIPIRYEDLLQSYQHSASGDSLPGIAGLVHRIQSLAKMSPDVELDQTFIPDSIGCSGHICHPSLNSMKQDAEYIAYLNEHLDWQAEQLMGYGKMRSKPSIDRIVVLGERHSRAEWLVERLARCFPDVNVVYGFGRPGKFFQTPSLKTNPPRTLVIAMFTNPFTWIEEMRLNPINAPAHTDMDWEDFITSPWERTRSNLDKNIVMDTSSEVCSFNFSYHEIVPCHTQRDEASDEFPLYEFRHSPSGEFDSNCDSAYSSLLELREAKILHFLSTESFPGVMHLIKLRYEDLVRDSANCTNDALHLTLPFPGIGGLLEAIRDSTTLIPVSAGWILDESGYFTAAPLNVEIDDEVYAMTVEKRINWQVEALVGYGP